MNGNSDSGAKTLSYSRLVAEATRYSGSGATSEELDCVPAFRDEISGAVYIATFADGRPAPLHLLAGLPDHLVAERDSAGQPTAALPIVTPGFLEYGQFYTREEMQALRTRLTRPRRAR